MNRIYQGKVTNVEIANPDQHAPRILSVSKPQYCGRSFGVALGSKVFLSIPVTTPSFQQLADAQGKH